MPVSALLLASLDAISHETTAILEALEHARGAIAELDRREAKRRTLEIRAKAQEFFEWLSASRLEEPKN